MTKRPSFKEFKEKMLQNVECKAAYEALCPEFELLMQRIKARQKVQNFKRMYGKG